VQGILEPGRQALDGFLHVSLENAAFHFGVLVLAGWNPILSGAGRQDSRGGGILKFEK
jgi:hypothetical protein